jgi:hypothetical protein
VHFFEGFAHFFKDGRPVVANERNTPMYISLMESRAKGFRRWSGAHRQHSNDDADGIARVDALAVAASGRGYAVMTPPDGPRAPWLVPGVGNTF